MSEDVTIVQTQENTVEFDLSVEGIDTSSTPEVRFIIQTNAMDMSFDCEQLDEEQWQVKIPAVSHLDKTTYPFRVEVIVDGYHFTPAKGNVQVTKGPDVKASQPANTMFKTPNKNKNKNNKSTSSKSSQNSGKKEKTQRTGNSNSRQNTKQQTGETEQPTQQPATAQQPVEQPAQQAEPVAEEQSAPEQPAPEQKQDTQPSVGFPTLKQTNDETPQRKRNDGYSIIKEAKRALNENPELMKNHQQHGETEKDVETIKQAIGPAIDDEQLSESEVDNRIKQVLQEIPSKAEQQGEQEQNDQPLFKKGDVVER